MSAQAEADRDRKEECIIECPGYVDPAEQDFMLPDIGAKEIQNISFAMDNENIGGSIAHFPSDFPVRGFIWGFNHRLMVSLACRPWSYKEFPPQRVIFWVNPSSPYTYLTAATMKSLLGEVDNTTSPTKLDVYIHCLKYIPTHVTPPNSHFTGINVLGMDFFFRNNVYPEFDWMNDSFTIRRSVGSLLVDNQAVTEE